MGASLKGCDTILKQNLRKDNTGGSINLTGRKIGSKTSMSIKADPRRKLRQISELRTPQSYSGFANTVSLAGRLVRPAKSRNGTPRLEIKIPCMGDEGIRVQDGKADAPRNASPFTHPPNGPQSFRKYGNVIITNAKCAAHHIMGCTSTISNHSPSKQNGRILITSSSSVQNVIGSSTVSVMSKGCS